MNRKHYRKGKVCRNCRKPVSDEATMCKECTNRDPNIWKHVWTQKQRQLLIDNYPKMQARELAILLGKNVKSIDYQVRKHYPFLKKHKPSIILDCAICGKSFKRYHSLLSSGKWGNFCSRKCRGLFLSENNVGEKNPRWRGGYYPYFGRNWHGIRREIRKERPLVCKRCGVPEIRLNEELHLHHIRPRRSFLLVEDSNVKDNLILLCNRCHKIVENSEQITIRIM